MSHEPKLTVYTITINPANKKIENSNRWLFRNMIGQANDTPLDDNFIFLELFKSFISALDRDEMFSDDKSKKCITANQANLADDDIDSSIIPHSNQYIIEGRIEGGSYGRKRNKTSRINKANKAEVKDEDAITDEFYFFIYTPPESNKMILMMQSYEGDSIDGIFNVFWKNFFSSIDVFKIPKVARFYPDSIIESFKKNSAVSGFQYTTEVPSRTLFGKSTKIQNQNFKVTIKITPTDDDISFGQFLEVAPKLANKHMSSLGKFNGFDNKKGTLRDISTGKQSPFELDSNFNIHPVILLSKFIDFSEGTNQFDLIKDYCFSLLEEIKPIIYPEDAVEER